jgi:hypothetical protein
MDQLTTICCLCNFQATSEDDLSKHIDQQHSDIFRICSDKVEEFEEISVLIKLKMVDFEKFVLLGRCQQQKPTCLCSNC